MSGDCFLVSRDFFEAATGDSLEEKCAFLDMVRRARFATEPDLKVGEFLGSVRTLATAWGWSTARTERYLRRNRDAKRIAIETQTGRKLSRITVCNITRYSPSAVNGETQTAPNRDANRDATETQDKQENLPVLSSKTALVVPRKRLSIAGNELALALASVECDSLKREEREQFEAGSLFAYWRSKTKNLRYTYTHENMTRGIRFIGMFGLETCLYAVDGVLVHPDHNHKDGSTHHGFTSVFNFKETDRTQKLAEYARKRDQRDQHHMLERLEKMGYRGE